MKIGKQISLLFILADCFSLFATPIGSSAPS